MSAQVRCYDNGGPDGYYNELRGPSAESIAAGHGTADRYTVVFVNPDSNGWYSYIGMSEHPTHPQGVFSTGEHAYPIDKFGSEALGKPTVFSSLPDECQEAVRKFVAQQEAI